MANQTIPNTNAQIDNVKSEQWQKGSCAPDWPGLIATTQLISTTEMGQFNV